METRILDPDQPLATAALQGDMNALDELVRRHQSWVFNLALRMVWRREVTEDAHRKNPTTKPT